MREGYCAYKEAEIADCLKGTLDMIVSASGGNYPIEVRDLLINIGTSFGLELKGSERNTFFSRADRWKASQVFGKKDIVQKVSGVCSAYVAGIKMNPDPERHKTIEPIINTARAFLIHFNSDLS